MLFIQYGLDAALYRNVGQYQKVSTAQEKTRPLMEPRLIVKSCALTAAAFFCILDCGGKAKQ